MSGWRGRTVAVTGGAGAIGARLVPALVARGARVLVVDDLSDGHAWNLPRDSAVRFLRGDVVEPATLRWLFRQGPEVVFHLAAAFANQRSLDDPEADLRVNALGTLRLLEHAVLAGRPRVVLASSGASFVAPGGPLPLDEAVLTLQLTTPYQAHKLLGEVYAHVYGHQYELPVVRARLFNAYGPGEVPGPYRNVVPNFVWWALHGHPLPITGDGADTRDFTYVDDTVDGLLALGAAPEAVGEAFCLARGVETTIAELAAAVHAAVGEDTGTITRPRRRWDDRRRRWADPSKARRVLGWSADTSLDAGLAATVAWMREHRERIAALGRFPPGEAPAVPGYTPSEE